MRKINVLLLLFYTGLMFSKENVLEFVPGLSPQDAYPVGVNENGGFLAEEARSCSDYVLIPDNTFESALLDQGIDTDGALNGQICRADAEKITLLSIRGVLIRDLTGIEAFVNLTNLFMPNTALTSVDLSANIVLRKVTFTNNNLRTINLSKNTKIEELYLSGNELMDIDLSNNKALVVAYLDDNALSVLDLDANINLRTLSFNTNKVRTLNLSNNIELKEFEAKNNLLEVIDFSMNLGVEKIFLQDNLNLERIDLRNGYFSYSDGLGETGSWLDSSNSPNLKEVCVDSVSGALANPFFIVDNSTVILTCEVEPSCPDFVLLPDVNFEQSLLDQGIDTDGALNGQICRADAEAVTDLNVSTKAIADVSGIEAFINVVALDMSSNQIPTIDLSNLVKLETLNLSDNALVQLDIDLNVNLMTLEADNNALVAIDLNQNLNLEHMSLTNNDLIAVNFSQNLALTHVALSNNLLTSFNVDRNLSLSHIDVSDNDIQFFINLKENTQLSYVDISNNQTLQLVLMDNGNNTNLITFLATGMTGCVQIDDEAYTESQLIAGNWDIDTSNARYNVNCFGSKAVGRKTLMEAEDFMGQKGVRLIDVTDAGVSSKGVGYLQPGDAVTYLIDVEEAGRYDLDLRVAGVFSGGKITIKSKGQVLGVVDMVVTGGWQNWDTIKTDFDLEAGIQDFTLEFSGASQIGNVNWLEFIKRDGQFIPGKVQAETFISQEGITIIDTEGTGEEDGIGYLQPDDSVTYKLDVTQSGRYKLALSVANIFSNGSIAIVANGVVIGQVVVPNTGGWLTWETVSTELEFTKGPLVLQLVFSGAAYIGNIDWMDFKVLSSNKSHSTAIKTKDSVFKVYPNPVDNGVVKFASGTEIIAVTLYTINGQKVIEKLGNVTDINVSELPEGLYILKTKTTEGRFMSKISIQN